MQNIWNDLKYAVRQLHKSRAFAVSTVLTLALGIGANLTVFLILYAVMLRPLPFLHPEQLVRVERAYPDSGLEPPQSGTTALFMRRVSRAFESSALYDYVPVSLNLIQGSEAIPLDALHVSSDFFHVFQMEPRIGRGFRTEDMTQHSPGVVVLSDAIWRRRFGGNPNVIGQSVTLGNEIYTVIGVANPKFRLDAKVDLWTPLRIAEGVNDQGPIYNFVGRLKPGVTKLQAQDDLNRVFAELKDVYPYLWQATESMRVVDYHDSLIGQIRPALEILMGAVGLVLLIAATNVLSLLLTRAIARRREMSLRVALGATGWRVLQQLLVENAILCIAGGCVGVLLAELMLPGLMHLSPIALPQFASLSLGGTGLVFTALLAVACTVLLSMVPAVESRRAQLNEALRVNSANIAGGRNLPQKFLVVGEVAISLMLLVAAGLLFTSFWKLTHVKPGFNTNVLTFKTSFTDQQAATSAVYAQRLNELATRLEGLPGVRSAAAVLALPTQLVPDQPFSIPGQSVQSGPAPDGDYLPITSHYFEAFGIPVIAGRSFTETDTPTSMRVAIINQQLARTYFRDQNPVGQHILIGHAPAPKYRDQVREIIGVVGNTKQAGLSAQTPGVLYVPVGQIPDGMTQLGNHLLGMSWVVRKQGANINVTDEARRAFMEVAQTPLLSVATMEDVMSASVAEQRFSMFLLCVFGLIALMLAGAGLYGVMSYSVVRRTKEIGIRMAVGAQRRDVSRMVLLEAGLLIGLGVVAGIVLSLAGTRALRSLLFSVGPRDPFTLIAMCAVLVIMGLLAAWWPARRAAKVDPMEALRYE